MFSLLEKNVIFKEGGKDDIGDTDHGDDRDYGHDDDHGEEADGLDDNDHREYDDSPDDNDHGEEDGGPDDSGRLRTPQAIVDCCKLSSCKLQAVLDLNFASLSSDRNKHLKT